MNGKSKDDIVSFVKKSKTLRVTHPGAILRRLFFELLALSPTAIPNGSDKVFTAEYWNKLIEAYINDPANAGKNSEARASMRGNLYKELKGDSMSWNVFCNKGMRVLQFAKFKITIEGVYDNGESISVSEMVHLRPEVLTDVELTSIHDLMTASKTNVTKGENNE